MSDAAPTLPEPLRSIISAYFDVELFWHSFPSDLQAYLAANPIPATRFKEQFAAAITGRTIAPDEYHALTNQKFGNEGELYSWLYQLWAEIYGDEPLPGDD